MAKNIKQSRKVIVAAGVVFSLLLIWFGLSLFGGIPDRLRMINRRYVHILKDQERNKSVGVLVIGNTDYEGKFQLNGYFTAVAISPEGYLLTTKTAAVALATSDSSFIYFGDIRSDVVVVKLEKLANIALLKMEHRPDYFFKFSRSSGKTNDQIRVAGFSEPPDNQPAFKWTTSLAEGRITHLVIDNLGVKWIEHDVTMTAYGEGGPVTHGNVLIAINVSEQSGITKAISLPQFTDQINKWIENYEKQVKFFKKIISS